MKRASPIDSARLAEKLKRIRLELLERLGFGAHLFRSNISQYERGHRIPSLLEYARMVNVDLSILIDDSLDLPEKLPNPSKVKGSGGSSKVAKKR